MSVHEFDAPPTSNLPDPSPGTLPLAWPENESLPACLGMYFPDSLIQSGLCHLHADMRVEQAPLLSPHGGTPAHPTAVLGMSLVMPLHARYCNIQLFFSNWYNCSSAIVCMASNFAREYLMWVCVQFSEDKAFYREKFFALYRSTVIEHLKSGRICLIQ